MRELSLNIMDIVQNSITAGASLIGITVEENPLSNRLSITITDNGRGMSEEQAANVQSPFFTTRTTRKVGLGIPLFKMAAEMTGGSLSLSSTQGKGTEIRAEFDSSHIDMTPLGNADETISLLITCNPDLDFVYHRSLGEKSFTLDTRELREVLEGVALNSPDVNDWIREYLAEQDEILKNSA